MSEHKGIFPHALARREEVVVQELPDEVLVYDLTNHKAHCLNQTAAFIWNHCDGKTSVEQLTALLEREYRQPLSEEVVHLALKQLSRAGLLEKGTMPNVEDGIRASRRAVLRKLGAAAAMTPLVISIIAPTASAGASIPPACTSCVKKISTAADCPTECVNVCGQCFDNSGCGQGGPINCQTCGVCAGQHGQGDTVSWVAPGDCLGQC